MTATLPAEMAALVKRAKEVLKDVTPGPWVYEYTCIGHTVRQPGAMNALVVANRSGDPEADGHFTAAARTLVPDLLDAIEALSTALIAARREGIEAAAKVADYYRDMDYGLMHYPESDAIACGNTANEIGRAIRALDQPTGG